MESVIRGWVAIVGLVAMLHGSLPASARESVDTFVLGKVAPKSVDGQPLPVERNNLVHGWIQKRSTVVTKLDEKRQVKAESTWTTVRAYSGILTAVNYSLPSNGSYVEAVEACRAVLKAHSFLAESDLRKSVEDWHALAEDAQRRPEGKAVLPGGIEVTMQLWPNGDQWKASLTVEVEREAMNALLLVAASEWAIAPHQSYTVKQDMFAGAGISADNELLVVAKRGYLGVIDLNRGEIVKTLTQIDGALVDGSEGAAFAGDTETVTLAGEKKKAFRISLSDQKILAERSFVSLSDRLMPDGSGVLSRTESGLAILSWESDQPVLEIGSGEKSRVIGISRDGARAVVMLPDRSLFVYDLKSGEKVAALEQAGDMESISFSSDYSRIAGTAFMNRQIVVWDGATGSKIQEMRANGIKCLALTPDGKRIASSTWTGGMTPNVVFIHDVDSGELLAELGHFVHAPFSLIISSDGRHLIAPMAHDDQVHVWQMDRLAK